MDGVALGSVMCEVARNGRQVRQRRESLPATPAESINALLDLDLLLKKLKVK